MYIFVIGKIPILWYCINKEDRYFCNQVAREGTQLCNLFFLVNSKHLTL